MLSSKDRIDSFSYFIINELKNFNNNNFTEENIANLLNLSNKDFNKVKDGKRELGMKEVHLLCANLGIKIDELYNRFSEVIGC